MIKLSNLIKEAEETSTKEEKEFAETRLGGAEKIVDNAKEKGGLSMLTWHHFKVKLPYYEKASKGKLDMSKAKEEYAELLEKLYKSTDKGEMSISQVAFQELLGKLEVLGELLIEDKEQK
jgi:hypothetical protein